LRRDTGTASRVVISMTRHELAPVPAVDRPDAAQVDEEAQVDAQELGAPEQALELVDAAHL
jgi:hypothetical protein